ncbi:unnamed protein product [Closterium sp. NIES-64]|nr:unnamed protein product [Closterium sp. NIES-64]
MRPDEAFGLVYSWTMEAFARISLALSPFIHREAFARLSFLTPPALNGFPCPLHQISAPFLPTLPTSYSFSSHSFNPSYFGYPFKVLFWASDEPTIASLKDRLSELYCRQLSKVRAPLEGVQEWLDALQKAILDLNHPRPYHCLYPSSHIRCERHWKACRSGWMSCRRPFLLQSRRPLHPLLICQVRAPLEGVQEWLDALQKAGVPCAVATSIDRLTLLSALDRMKLLHHFQAFVTAEDDMESMAHRFLSAAVKLDRAPAKCVVFEDDPRGITAAHNCSMKAVALIGTHPAYELKQADLAVSSYAELSVINLRRLFANRGHGIEHMELKKQREEQGPKKRRWHTDTLEVTVSADSDTNGSSDVTIEGAKLVLEEPVLAGDVSIAGEKQVWQGEDEEDSWEMDAEAEVTIMRAVDKGTAPKPPPLSKNDRERVNNALKHFATRGWAADQALAIYIPSRFFPTAASKFRRFVLRCCRPELASALAHMGAGRDADEFLFPLFAEFCFGEFPEEIRNYRDLVNSADMTKPHVCLVCSCPELASALAHMGAGRDADEFLFPLFAEFFFGEYPVLEKIRSYRDQAARVVSPGEGYAAQGGIPPGPHQQHCLIPSFLPSLASPIRYPQARAMPRKVVYHMGPTNSGKTHRALVRFKEASSGTYCGPLRLLAMEVFDRVNADGVYCNLVTGQERKEMPFAHHTACTIEMANLSTPVDVAVIDEIQMISDDYRGWAWTRALLGVQAAEVHVCGDPSVLPLLRAICDATGDAFECHHYHRFAPLTVDQVALSSFLSSLQAHMTFRTPPTCAFLPSHMSPPEGSGDDHKAPVLCGVRGTAARDTSHTRILPSPHVPCTRLISSSVCSCSPPIQRAVEMTTKHRCCVVYGALPPETRRQQARLFNEEESDFRVLVASDAIGMGLNLSIRRVVFSTLHKFNGEEKIIIPSPMVRTGAHMGVSLPSVSLPSVPLPSDSLPSVSLPSVSPSISFPTTPVKQIAGRAGRRGSRYEEGVVTCLDPTDMPLLIAALQEPVEPTTAAGLFPLFEQDRVERPPRLLASSPSSNRATKAAATMTTPEGQNVPSLEQSAGVEAGVGTSTSPPTAEGQVAPVVPPAPASGVPEPVAPSPAVPSAYAPAGGDEDDEDDDDGYLSDDSDEGIDVHAKGALAAKARVTLTLLIPFALAKEMPAVKPSVKALLVFLRKKLSDNALDVIAFQELLPTYLSKVHFSRLQVTLATAADAEVVRQHRVEHVVGTTKHHFGWLHPFNRAFVKAKTDLPEGVEVLLKGVPAEITPLIVYESLAVAKLQKRGRPAFQQGAGFHRVVDPVSGLDTDKIRGLDTDKIRGLDTDKIRGLDTDKIRGLDTDARGMVPHPGDARGMVPHPGDKYRWRHVVEDPLTDASYLVHYPSLPCRFCQGPHMDKLHDESAANVRPGIPFAQAAAHISSFSHDAALGTAGVATRATKAKQALQAAKKLYGIRAEKAKGK